MNRPLRIALTKGRLEKDTVGLLEKIGYDCTAIREKGRKLILPVPDGNLEVVLAKANDVITYVEHGVCDMGVVGKDTIMEMQGKFFELVDIGFGRCKFALATKKGSKFYGGFDVKTVATWDWEAFWSMTAFLSVILAFMNILPIPALDGGHVLFLLYEVITRRKPNDKFMEYAQMGGMLFLFALLIYANGNDIFRFFFK